MRPPGVRLDAASPQVNAGWEEMGGRTGFRLALARRAGVCKHEATSEGTLTSSIGGYAVGRSAEYHRPVSLAEACNLLEDLGPDALPIAGGTDVMVDLRRGTRRPGHLVSLARLEELRGIHLEGGLLRVGAAVTPAQLLTSEKVAIGRPELRDAVGVFGTPQVRNRATVGGNLCTAASCGDLAPLLLVLGARLTIQGPGGRREFTLDRFFGHHRHTILQPGQILVEVAMDAKVPGEGAAYEAFGLRATNSITVAGAAACLRVEEGRCKEARVAVGAVAPTPLLAPGAGEMLLGGTLTDEELDAAASAVGDATAPISDVRGSAEYRGELVERLAARALRRARGRVL